MDEEFNVAEALGIKMLAFDNGDIDTLELAIEVKMIEKVLKDYKSILRDAVLSELGSEKNFTLLDWQFGKTTGKASHSYKHIPEWVEAVRVVKEIEEKAKQAYNVQSSGAIMVGEENGDIAIPSNVSYGSPSYSLKFVGDKKK